MAGAHRARRRGSGVALVAAGVVLLVVAGLVAATRRPVYLVVPAAPPAVGSSCGGDGLGPSGGRSRPWVDDHPDGAVVWWVPGVAQPCGATVVTELDAAAAGVLAHQVRTARAASGGRACPSEDGRSATVWFTYAHQVRAEVVRFTWSGCRSMSAPGRAYRRVGEPAFDVLTGVAPASFH